MKTANMLLMLLMLVSSASAHNLYAEFPDELLTDSQAEFWIAYGHVGSADTKLESLPIARIIAPDGKKTDLVLEPYKDGLKGMASLEAPGSYILDLQMTTTFFDPAWFGAAGSKSLVEKYGRVLMPCQSGEGYDWSSGLGMEVVCETDPYQLNPQDEFNARVLYNGKAVPGSYTAVITRHPDDVLVVQHIQDTEVAGESSDGSISFKVGPPGLWVLSFEANIDEKGSWIAVEDDPNGNYQKGDELEYEQIAPTAYLTFWVSK